MLTVKTTKQGRPCGFCTTGGRHDLCPGGVLNGNGTEVVLCGCEEHPPVLRCLDCGLKALAWDVDVNSDTWACFDQDACQARRTVAREKANRELFGDAPRPEASKSREVTDAPKKAPARAKEGKCLHCGEPTKGGLFLPGHDSAYVSAAAHAIRNPEPSRSGTLEEVLAQWEAQGISEALRAKLAKRVA